MKRILLVDDDETIRYALSEILKKEYEVLETSGVNDALKKLETDSVDLICSDYNMKDGTGLDLLEDIRHKGISVPFLLMTCDDDYLIKQQAQFYGGAYCCKTECNLITKIKALVNFEI